MNNDLINLDLFFYEVVLSNGDNNETDNDSNLDTILADKTQTPKMWKVLIHNDDYTTMEFVIHVIIKFFNKNIDEAQSIMLKVHHEGQAVCGIYTCEIAETLTSKINTYSRSKGHPLKSSCEPCE